MHGMIIGHGTDDQNGRGYRVRVTITDHGITRKKRHITLTKILAEYYLQTEMSRAKQTLAADSVNSLNISHSSIKMINVIEQICKKRQYKQGKCQKHIMCRTTE